jgi:bifunctional DNA primase/polymerase-like protein
MSCIRTTHTGQGRLHGCEYVIEACERWGFFCFPVDGENKTPKLKDYLRRSTRNPTRIKNQHDYWTKQLGYEPLWGVAPALSGILPGDVDVKDGKRGRAHFDWFELEHGWPPTLMSRSPSGGFHLWYRGPHLYRLGREKTCHAGIDFAQYLVLPGGPPRKKGGRYVWTNELPIAAAPQWIYDMVAADRGRKRERVAWTAEGPFVVAEEEEGIDQTPVIPLDLPQHIVWAVDYLRRDAPPSHAGDGGEWAVFEIAATLKDYGISYEKAVELINNIYNNKAHCKPPWSDAVELRAKIANGYRYANKRCAPGGATALYEFQGDEIDVDSIPVSISEAEARRQARGRRLMSDARTFGLPIIRTRADGYSKTKRYVRGPDGVKIPVFDKD